MLITARKGRRKKSKGVREPEAELQSCSVTVCLCIDWADTRVTVPPITKLLTLQDFEENIKSGPASSSTLTSLPCHTKNVGRAL